MRNQALSLPPPGTEPNPEQDKFLALQAAQRLIPVEPQQRETTILALQTTPESFLYQATPIGGTIVLHNYAGPISGVCAYTGIIRGASVFAYDAPSRNKTTDSDLLLELVRQLSPQSVKQVLEYARTLKRQSEHKIKPDKKERLKVTRIREA